MYFDEAADRKQAEHDASIEAVRFGTIFAHDAKAHQKWRGSRLVKSQSLVGDALEAAVAGIAQMFPGNVVHGTV